MALVELYRRIAETETGQKLLDYERDSAYQYAYGSMYFSLFKGVELTRTSMPVCGELQEGSMSAMTTEELITQLNTAGVEDEYAGGFRNMKLRVDASRIEEDFKIPVAVDGGLVYIAARFTGEDRDFSPEWVSVSEVKAVSA